jgi:RNA polymerase sigma-70 factor (ECF subfamily)
MSDEDVIRMYLDSHDAKFYSILYDRYSNKVYGKCISLLKSESRAEDATQDIFIKIMMNLSKFSGKSKFSTWVYSITYNYCIDLIRRKKKDPSVLMDNIASEHDPIEEVNDQFLLETNIKRLKIVLEEIPVGDKAILLMKYQDSLSIREIGEMLNKSESAIKMKIKRAKLKFKKVHSEKYKD